MKKRILSILLCLCMAVSLLPGVALATTGLIEVNGVNIIGESTTGTVKGVSYEDGVLTLENATIKQVSDVGKNAGIYANGELTINLVGENAITVTGDSGIYVCGDLTFTGPGSLTINVTKRTDAGAPETAGIRMESDKTLDVQADATVTVETAAYGLEVPQVFSYSGTVVTLEGTGELTLKGSKYGIKAEPIKIKGASFTAEGGTAALSTAPEFKWVDAGLWVIPDTYFNTGVKLAENAPVNCAWRLADSNYTTATYVNVDYYNLVFGELLKTVPEPVNLSEDKLFNNEPAIALLGDTQKELTINVTGDRSIVSAFDPVDYYASTGEYNIATVLLNAQKGYMNSTICAPYAKVTVTGSGSLTVSGSEYGVVAKKGDSGAEFETAVPFNGMVTYYNGSACFPTAYGRTEFAAISATFGAAPTDDPNKVPVLTVDEEATLVVPEATKMKLDAVLDDVPGYYKQPSVAGVKNKGTIQNDGVIVLPPREGGSVGFSFYGEIPAPDKLSKYLGRLTGTGYIYVSTSYGLEQNEQYWKNDGAPFDGPFPSYGLDLTAAKEGKLYKAGAGWLTWTPTLDDETSATIVGGKLTLDNVTISVTGDNDKAITLPNVPMTVELIGESSIESKVACLYITGVSNENAAQSITFTGEGTLTLNAKGNESAVNSQCVISKDVTIVNEGRLNGTITNYGKLVNNASGSDLLVQLCCINEGVLENTGSMTIIKSPAGGTTADCENKSVGVINNSGDLYFSGAFTNSGKINNESSLVFNTASFTNTATGVLNNQASISIDENSSLTNTAGGTVRNDGRIAKSTLKQAADTSLLKGMNPTGAGAMAVLYSDGYGVSNMAYFNNSLTSLTKADLNNVDASGWTGKSEGDVKLTLDNAVAAAPSTDKPMGITVPEAVDSLSIELVGPVVAAGSSSGGSSLITMGANTDVAISGSGKLLAYEKVKVNGNLTIGTDAYIDGYLEVGGKLTITGGSRVIIMGNGNATTVTAGDLSGVTVPAGYEIKQLPQASLDSVSLLAVAEDRYAIYKTGESDPYTGPVVLTSVPASGGDTVYCQLAFETNGGGTMAGVYLPYGTNEELAKYVPVKAGYTFEGWCSDKELTTQITSVQLTKDTTVYAKWTAKSDFTDVPDDSYYKEAVDWAVDNGITNGVSSAIFDPNGLCTRAQAVTFLWRAMGSPEPTAKENPFTDVAADDYYYKAVLWAVEKGISSGTGTNTFAPNDACSRAQFVTFLWRAVGKPAASATNPFTDVKSGEYYESAVLWAVEKGITQGTSTTTFSPNDACVRAQIVTFLYRHFGK